MVPSGLALQLNVISPETETEIVNWLDTREWSTDLSRRTQDFGHGYNYRNKSLTLGSPLDGKILICAQILIDAGLMNPQQCIVNEYTRNQGIAPHIDNKGFGPVVFGLSINADAVMLFEKDDERFECFLPRRSLVMLSGKVRYEWKHSISKNVTYIDDIGNKIVKPENYRRISLTYRELAEKR